MPLNPVPNWPASADSLPDPTSANFEDDDGFEIDLLLQKHNALLELIEAVVGNSESSPQNTPLANTVLQSLTNGKFKWATIVTAMLAANAITQVGSAIGSSSDPTTTSTSFVDLTDMSVTLTTTGGDLIAILVDTTSNNTTGQVTYQGLKLDSGSDVSIQYQHTATANYSGTIVSIALFTSVSAASHTVKGRWRVLGGTGTAAGTQRILIVLERKK